MYLGEGREGETALGQELLRPYLYNNAIHACFCEGGGSVKFCRDSNEHQIKRGKIFYLDGKKVEAVPGPLITESDLKQNEENEENVKNKKKKRRKGKGTYFAG